MYCPRCDKHFGDEYVVCPECGDVLRQESNNFETPVHNQTFNGQVVENKGTTYIILSILELLCCSPIAGIVALVLAIIGNSNFNKGDYDGAANMWKYTKITLWIGVGLAVVSIILSFVLGVGSIMAVVSNLSA